jgi:hypothetical protein
MSKRYWVIAPFNSKKTDIWDKVWPYDLENGIISIGWGEIGDASKFNEEELREEVEKVYGEGGLRP